MINRSISRIALLSATLLVASVDALAEQLATDAAALPATAATPVGAPAPMVEAAPAVTPAAPSESSFDSYQTLAITAGLIGGSAVAMVLTDGLILPIYCWATGSAAVAEVGAGGSLAAGAARLGAGAGAGSGTGLFRGVMQTLGAVGGGLYANSWYRAE